MICKFRNAMLPTLISISVVFPALTQADWDGNVSGEQILDGDNAGSVIRFELVNNDRPFSQTIFADYLNTDASGSGFAVGYEPQFWFGDTFYVFGEASASTSGDDTVSFIRTIGAGVGADIINSPSRSLYAEVGVNQLATIFDEDEIAVGAEDTVTSITSTATLGGLQQVSNILKLGLSLDYIQGEDIVITNTTASVIVRIPGGSLVYDYSIRTDRPDIGDSTEDTSSSISFEYDF